MKQLTYPMNKNLLKAKAHAMLIHFSICFSVFLLILAWVALIAYSGIYFFMAGAPQGLTIVFLVDVVLGPLICFLIYNPAKSKKETVSDFSIIAVIQIAALIYGVHTLYMEQPRALIIYPGDNAIVVNHRELQDFSEILTEKGDIEHSEKIAGLPAFVYQVAGGKGYFVKPSEALESIKRSEKAALSTIASLKDEALDREVAHYKAQGKVYILSVMAKSKGAYFVLDDQLHYLAKFGEKDI